MKSLATIFLLLTTLLCATTSHAQSSAAPQLTVFAAASLKDAMDEAGAAWQRRSGQVVRTAYAGSSALARQIEQGAPADVFISADQDWMDWLQQRRLIDARSRHDLLGNTLVLVAPARSNAQPLRLSKGTDLRPLLGRNGRIALALTSSVPAGKYAKAAFESLGMWTALQSRTAEADNVRAALLLVSRGEAPLGVVYASDAKADPGVRVLATFPAGTHPKIVYPVARIASSRNPHAAAFVHWLQSADADAIFRKHGFSVR